MKYETPIRVFKIAHDGGDWEEDIQQLARGLRETLCRLILSFGKYDIANIEEAIERIREFSIRTKHHAILKRLNPKPKSNCVEGNAS